MKVKKLIVVALILAMMCCAGCQSEKTHHAQKDSFYAGETIELYDDESQAQLGSLVIKDIQILSEEPYEREMYLCPKGKLSVADKIRYDDELIIRGDDVYYMAEYRCIVRIDYDASTIDSSNRISAKNFAIFDHNDQAVDRTAADSQNIQVNSKNSIVVGMQEKGDLRIDFSFYTNQTVTCKIICEFDAEANKYIIRENDSGVTNCSECNKEVNKEDAYCRYCGEKLK